MTKTKWIIFAVICLSILGFVVFTAKNNKPEVTFKGDASKIITEGVIKDHVYGSMDQKVVLIEYGDFECPACGQMYEPVKNLTEKYKEQLTFIFREFPLTNIHPNALAGATAAEAAGLQGKFWEMHSLLYQNQAEWRGQNADVAKRTQLFEDYARQLGVDTSQFKKDLANKAISEKIERDRATGKNFGVDATPTFILNGKKIPTATSEADLAKMIEQALKDANYKIDETKVQTPAPAE